MKSKAFKPRVVELIKLLQNKKVKPENLSYRERRQIIKYFLEEQSEVSNSQIGELIGTTGQNVGQVKKTLLKAAAWEIDELDVKALAVSLKRRKEEYQRKAAKDHNYSLAWKIEIDFIEKMQSLGFIRKAAETLNLNQAMAMSDCLESISGYDKEDGKTK
jgi:hypothetical protein